MAEDLMRYDILAQHALRGVVRLALRRVERDGLPGEHHFFISFKTEHDGVRISEKLKSRHPEEMTIVLQHQYWNLKVFEERFEVELSFDNVPEKMSIPFAAVKGFFDPTVQFGLQFESEMEASENGELVSGNTNMARDLQPANSDDQDGERGTADSEPDETGKKVSDEKTGEDDDASKVVSLDAFRKK